MHHAITVSSNSVETTHSLSSFCSAKCLAGHIAFVLPEVRYHKYVYLRLIKTIYCIIEDLQ